MRKLAVLLLLPAASCMTEQEQMTQQAREGFEEWVRAVSEAETIRTYHGLSDAFRSQWIFDLLESDDPPARRWRIGLAGTEARTLLDLWWGRARKNKDGRAEPLEAAVLEHPSTRELWAEYIRRNAGALKIQMTRIQIANTSGDASGITITVRGAGGGTELYAMVYERDGWKIDNYKSSIGPPR